MTAIRLTGVQVACGKLPVLSKLDLSVEPGTITALVGRNGSGKTTVLKLAAGVDPPDAGEVSILGRTPHDAREWIGFVQEDPTLPEGETPLDLVWWITRMRGGTQANARWVAMDALRRCGVAEVANARAAQLSRGQRQQVALAAAIACAPRVLLLDEPFSGLDPANAEALRSLVGQLAADGAAVLFTSHQPEDVERVADRVAVLGGGRVLAHDTLGALRCRTSRGAVDLRVRCSPEHALEAISRASLIADVQVHGDVLRAYPRPGVDVPTVIAHLANLVPCRQIGEYEPSLAEVFAALVPADSVAA